MKKVCAVMTCRWRKQEVAGAGGSQKPILTPDYTQCTTLAVSQLASCPTELKGSFMPIAAQWGSKTYYFEG